MSRIDSFIGSVCVVATALLFFNEAARCVVEQPGWRGIAAAASMALTGSYAVISIWRDRL